MRRKRKSSIVKKFFHYPQKDVFAICYPSDNVIYYNLDFAGKCKITFMIPKDESETRRYRTNLERKSK